MQYSGLQADCSSTDAFNFQQCHKDCTQEILVGTVFTAWGQLRVYQKDHYGLDKPLFHYTWFPEQTVSKSESISFISAGVAKVSNLIDEVRVVTRMSTDLRDQWQIREDRRKCSEVSESSVPHPSTDPHK